MQYEILVIIFVYSSFFIAKAFLSVNHWKVSVRYNVGVSKDIVVALAAKLCPTSPAGSSIRGISQTRVLEWVATLFSRGSSRPRD